MGVDDTSRIRRAANLLKTRLVARAEPITLLIGVGMVGTGVGWRFGLGYGLISAGGLLLIDLRT